MADFSLVNHYSIFLLTPKTEAAKEWVAEHLDDNLVRHGNGIAVEPRYVEMLVGGIRDDGLEVE